MVVELWCDLASTYTYLAVSRVRPIAAARKIELAWTPFLLGPIFETMGWPTSPFEVYPAKGRYMWRDMERTAARLELPFKRPSVFPRHSVLAARVAALGVTQAWGPDFICAASRANFAEDREIGEPSVVDELLGELGVSGPEVRAAVAEPGERKRLRAATMRAGALGIFGAPTFVVGSELFWGNDRLEEAFDWAARR